MDPKAAAELAKGLADGGTPYLLYVFAMFCILVVAYLCRDYVTTHKTMILVIEDNTRVMKRVARHLKRSRFSVRPGVRNSGTPPSDSVQRAVPMKLAKEN